MVKTFKTYLMKESKVVNDYIDNLLDKIAKSGMDSLTPKEKEILNKYKSGKDITADINQPQPIKKTPPRKGWAEASGSNVSDLEKKLGLKSGQLSGTEITQIGPEGGETKVFMGDDEMTLSTRQAQQDLRGFQKGYGEKFEKGDVVRVIDKAKKKLSDEAYQYLMSKKIFEIRKTNDQGKLDIGCRIDGKIIYFNSNRFSKKIEATVNNNEEWWQTDKKTSKDLDPYDEENWNNNNNNDEDILPKNSFKFLIGRPPRDMGIDAKLMAYVVLLVDSDFGEAGWVYDQEISACYEELDLIEGFDEIMEGTFEYDGILDGRGLVNVLRNMGFNAELGNLNQDPPFPI